MALRRGRDIALLLPHQPACRRVEPPVDGVGTLWERERVVNETLARECSHLRMGR